MNAKQLSLGDIHNEVKSVETMLSPLIIESYLRTGFRLHNFNIGLSMESPKDTDPINMAYCICDRYNGTSFTGEIIRVNCSSQCDTGRFLIIHMPNGDDYLNLSEVEIYEGKTSFDDFSSLRCTAPVLTSLSQKIGNTLGIQKR